MSVDLWNANNVKRILRAVIVARKPLTRDEATILLAVAAGFGVNISEAIQRGIDDPARLVEAGGEG